MTAREPAAIAPIVTLRPLADADRATAAALLDRLGAARARLADPADATARERGWTLRIDGLSRVLTRPDGARLAIDFTAGRNAARAREGDLAGQPLARAIGLSRLRRRLGRPPTVVDATAGLGGDAWVFAALGCSVTLIEREPLVHTLLEAALGRAAATAATSELAARVRLLDGEATARLATLERAAADVVYLDPMYPPTRRRAAAGKGMQFLHELLDEETDDDGALLGAALGAAGHRVTVKRPKGAPPLAGDAAFDGQRSTIASPTTRYDVYHVAR